MDVANAYEPAAQLMQLVETVAPVAVEYLPTAQAVQSAEAVAAVVAENVPAAQAVQLDDAVDDVNIPAGHSTQLASLTY